MVYRLTTGGVTADNYYGSPNPVPNNWVRLTRVGNVLTSFISANGTSWTQIGVTTYTSLPATMLYGLAVSSYNNGVLCTATFDNVQIIGGATLTAPSAPTNLAATNISTGVSLTWTDVATNEASYRVERAIGSGAYAAIANPAANATSYTDTSTTAGTTYNYRVSAVNTAGLGTATPVTVTTPASTGLTLTGLDIGAVNVAGSNSVSGGVYTIKGTGDNIYYIADSFRFASTSISGDADIRARLTSMTNTGDWAKAGVMIRESNAAGSRHAMLFSAPAETGNGFDMIYRTATDGTTADSYLGSPNPVPNNWMRLTRVGNVITSYVSENGTNWTQIDAINFTNLPATMLYGLGVTSYNNGTLCTATFDNVQIITGTSAPLAARVTTSLISSATTSPATTSSLSANQDSSGNTSLSFTRTIGSTVKPTLQLIDDLTKSPNGWRTSTLIPTTVSNGDGTETLSFANLSSAFTGEQGFARIHIEQDTNGDGFADMEENGEVFGFTRRTYTTGTTTFGNAFASSPIVTAQVGAVQGNIITLSTALPSLKHGSSYYLEFIRGTFQGHRFDLDESSANGARISIETNNPRNTLITPPSSLVGDTVVVRAHQTVSTLFPETSFTGTTNAQTADRISFYNGTAYETLWLLRKPDGTKNWVRVGDVSMTNFGGRVVDVTEGAMVQLRSARTTLTTNGLVRPHRIALPLKTGSQLIANVLPGSVSFNTLGLTTTAGFIATSNASTADRVDLLASDLVASATGFRSLSLLLNGSVSQWTDTTDPATTDLSNTSLIGAMRALFIKSTTTKAGFFIPVNWRP